MEPQNKEQRVMYVKSFPHLCSCWLMHSTSERKLALLLSPTEYDTPDASSGKSTDKVVLQRWKSDAQCTHPRSHWMTLNLILKYRNNAVNAPHGLTWLCCGCSFTMKLFFFKKLWCCWTKLLFFTWDRFLSGATANLFWVVKLCRHRAGFDVFSNGWNWITLAMDGQGSISSGSVCLNDCLAQLLTWLSRVSHLMLHSPYSGGVWFCTLTVTDEEPSCLVKDVLWLDCIVELVREGSICLE